MSEFGGFWKTHRYRMRNTVNMYFYNNEVGRLKSETKTNEKRKNRKKNYRTRRQTTADNDVCKKGEKPQQKSAPHDVDPITPLHHEEFTLPGWLAACEPPVKLAVLIDTAPITT